MTFYTFTQKPKKKQREERFLHQLQHSTRGVRKVERTNTHVHFVTSKDTLVTSVRGSKTKKRREIFKEKKLCFNWLVGGHQSRECRRTKACFTCGRMGHNSSVCFGKNWTPQDRKPDQTERKPEEKKSSFTMGDQMEQVIMATSPATVTNPENGRKATFHIYLDTGAKFTAVKESAIKSLGLGPPKNIELETSRFNSKTHDRMKVGTVELEILGKSGERIPIQAFTTQNIAAPIHLQPVEMTKEQKRVTDRYHLNNLPSKSPDTWVIDIIVGLDWFRIMGPRVANTIEVGEELYIYCTLIGNIITGVANRGT
jgi:hypothetical protein